MQCNKCLEFKTVNHRGLEFQCHRVTKSTSETSLHQNNSQLALLQPQRVSQNIKYRRLLFQVKFQNHCIYILYVKLTCTTNINWAASSEFVSSSIPSWQTLTAHAQQFRRARDLVFCLKVPLDSLLVWASSEGSGETARMRRLAWTFAARIGDKYQIRLTRPNCSHQ